LPNNELQDLPFFLSKVTINFVWQIIAGYRHNYKDGKLLDIMSFLKTTTNEGAALMTGPAGLSPLFE